MLKLRRLLLAALLMGLAIGCKVKSQPVGAEETPEEHLSNKIKVLQKAPEGPQLVPKR
jgi:hypothetical protein